MRYFIWAARAAALAIVALSLLAGVESGRAKAHAQDLSDSVMLEQGLATWYGPGFEGRRTACGYTYWSSQYTAASNTLPCGAVVTVTNLDTGAAVDVTITDRGAFRYPIVVDLSVAAFSAIGHTDQGVARVGVSAG